MEFLTLDLFLLAIRILVDIWVFALILAMLKRISFLESQLKELTGVVSGVISLVKDHEKEIRNTFVDVKELSKRLNPKQRVTNESTTTETRK